jgi:hypothetical protein
VIWSTIMTGEVLSAQHLGRGVENKRLRVVRKGGDID